MNDELKSGNRWKQVETGGNRRLEWTATSRQDQMKFALRRCALADLTLIGSSRRTLIDSLKRNLYGGKVFVFSARKRSDAEQKSQLTGGNSACRFSRSPSYTISPSYELWHLTSPAMPGPRPLAMPPENLCLPLLLVPCGLRQLAAPMERCA